MLAAAGVPKGSFYHHFGSKDAFGEAMIKSYFDDYFATMDGIVADKKATEPALGAAQRVPPLGRRRRDRPAPWAS